MTFRLKHSIQQLLNGAIIAYPTETVWGLGCLPNNPSALQHLANIKQRSSKKGFILVSPTIELCLPFIDPKFHSQAKHTIKINTQKPTTWLVPKSQQTSVLITGQFNNVAIRISPHPFIRQVCNALKMPLISTSANLHARPSLTSSLLVQRFLGHKVDYIAHGYKNGSGLASTIIDLKTMRVIRH